MRSSEALVRVVTPLGAGHPSHFGYVSVIRFANCYSVVLSNDPTGYAGGNANRLNVTQTQSLGFAAKIANAVAARSEVMA